MSIKYKGATPEQVSEFMSKLADAANLSSLTQKDLLELEQDMRRFGTYFQWFIENYEGIHIDMLSSGLGSTVRSIPQVYDPRYQRKYIESEVFSGRLILREGVYIKPMEDKSRTIFKLLLMTPNTAKQTISHEFAVRNLESASGFEVVRLLATLRNSKKSDYPFVSVSDSIVAHFYAGSKDGPIVVRPIDTKQDVRQMNWSYVGTKT